MRLDLKSLYTCAPISQQSSFQSNRSGGKLSERPENEVDSHCLASKTHAATARPSGSHLRLWRLSALLVTRAAVPDGSSVTCTPPIPVKMPPHRLVQGMLNPSPGKRQFATVRLLLQIFSSTAGFEAIQIWWLLCSSWRDDAGSRALHWYALFTYCLCVHLLIWGIDTAPFFFFSPLWRPQRHVGSHYNHLTLSRSFQGILTSFGSFEPAEIDMNETDNVLVWKQILSTIYSITCFYWCEGLFENFIYHLSYKLHSEDDWIVQEWEKQALCVYHAFQSYF